MSIEQSVIFCDYNTRLMDVPKSCFLPNKIGHKTTKNLVYYCNLFISLHSALMRNLMKVPSRGGRECSRGLKSALSEILQNKEHFY